MSEWKIYEGTDEQIEEILNAGGYVYRNDKGYESSILMAVGKREELISELNDDNVTHYLICKKHPLADMICRQAATGQPVYINLCSGLPNDIYVTTRPNWNIPGAEYSFNPFD